MGRKVCFEIPDERIHEWEQLMVIYGVSESELAWLLIKDELAVIGGEKEREAYERMEAAARQVYKVLGSDYLDQFSREVELVAKKLVEHVEGPL
jgi:hypothetical protein